MSITVECKWCNQEYDAKRSTSLYCSPKCKQDFYRNRMTKEPVTLNAKSITVNAKSVTVRNAKPVTVTKPKCGKDIKCFADLPPDVQQTIDDMSDTPEEKARRTQAAIRYQHLFPDRYHSTSAVCSGVVIGKPGDADYNGICTKAWIATRRR